MSTAKVQAKAQDRDAAELVAELNALVEQIEQHPDTEIREKALDLTQLILHLYGDALTRILRIVESLPIKDQIVPQLLNDEVIRAILLIHGLMPVELYDRVVAALDHFRPFLISQGCDVELIGVDDGRARMRLIRSGKGAPPIAALKTEIEKVLNESAPDLLGVEIDGFAEGPKFKLSAASTAKEGAAAPNNKRSPPLVQISRSAARTPDRGTWVSVVRALGFEEDHFRIANFQDINVLVCKIGGEFHAYRNSCAGGPRSLDDALFDSPMLTCSCHGYSYDLRRGSCLERPDLRLQSMPVKVEDDKVKVAM